MIYPQKIQLHSDFKDSTNGQKTGGTILRQAAHIFNAATQT